MATTQAAPATPSPAAATRVTRSLADRLTSPMPTDRVAGWLWPLAVTVLAGVLRFAQLSRPSGVPGTPGVVFDETYYAHDAYNLLTHGVELTPANNAPGFVVHPPLGKWLIAVGEWLFDHGTIDVKGTIFPNGYFGWRFSSAVIGTLAVLVLARAARRMFRSTLLGCVAGLLLALDGLELVQSRVAMLDIFLMFWIVAAFACLLADRDDGRRRLAGAVDQRRRWLGVRWWRLGAGICLGAATATKWDGAFLVPAFLLLSWAWDAGARRVAGQPRPRQTALLLDGLPSLVPLLVVPVVVYVLSWLGWFLGNAGDAYDHDLYVHAGQGALAHAWAVFRGWLSYQHAILSFHANLTTGHPYLSEPWSWLLLGRPVAYWYESLRSGQLGCHVANCSQEVLALGNPLIWWVSIPALLAMAWLWLARRDWRSGAILLSFAFGYLPWFYEAIHHRTMFFFYALAFLPFMVLAITQCCGLVLGPALARPARRIAGAAAVGVYLTAVSVLLFFFYPVLTAQVVPYSSWHARMWFTSCTNNNDKHETAPCWI